MIIEDELQRLAELPANTVVQPVDEIRRRAEGLRRSRRLARTAAAGLVAAGAAATAFTVGPFAGEVADPRGVEVLPAGPTATGPTTAPQPEQGCDVGVDNRRTFADAPELLFLAPESVTGPIAGDIFVRDEQGTCASPPAAAVRYGMDGDTVGARVRIEGPGARNAYTADPGMGFAGEETTADLHGATARIYRADADGGNWGYAWWQDAEGRGWSADVGGLDREGMVRALLDLTGDGGAFDAAARPANLDRVLDQPPPAPGRLDRYVSTAYGNVDQDLGGWTVEHHDGYGSAEALSGSERVDVGGLTGWWSPNQKHGGLAWRTSDGVLHIVSGNISREKAIEVAESLRKVSPDDPRLAAHAEKAAPPS